MKGAMEVLTRYQAKELGERGISVNIIAPGAIETDFGGGVVRDNAQVNQHIAAQTALGRVGLPDDIGDAIAALLSDDLRWMNAQRVEVSGGDVLVIPRPSIEYGGANVFHALSYFVTDFPHFAIACVSGFV